MDGAEKKAETAGKISKKYLTNPVGSVTTLVLQQRERKKPVIKAIAMVTGFMNLYIRRCVF